jgi:hypothetical protein
MSLLTDGHYKTRHGSEMWVKGGRSKVAFDWLEERNACCDCSPEPYAEDGSLVWHCDVCGGGKAKLYPCGTLDEGDIERASQPLKAA